MTDELFLTLASGLEHAATALDVVDDEARQQIASLLSPKARQLLAALTAADHAPPPPTAVRAPPIAVAHALCIGPAADERLGRRAPDREAAARERPPSVSGRCAGWYSFIRRFADALYLRRRVRRNARRRRAFVAAPRARSGSQTVPDARDDWELADRRAGAARPPPRVRANLPPAQRCETAADNHLDDYTLSLELDLTQAVPLAGRREKEVGPHWYVGAFSGDDEATFEFTVPDDSLQHSPLNCIRVGTWRLRSWSRQQPARGRCRWPICLTAASRSMATKK